MRYRFARCKQPLTMGLMRKCGLPLPESELDVLEPTLHWEQLKVQCDCCISAKNIVFTTCADVVCPCLRLR